MKHKLGPIDEITANEMTSLILDKYDSLIPDQETRDELFPQILDLVVIVATELGTRADTLIRAELGIN